MTDLGLSLDNLAINAISVWLIQHLKCSKSSVFGWISANTPGVSRFLSAVLASATAVGISWSFQSNGGVLTISGLSWMALAAFIWHACKNYVFQHVIYKSSYGMEQALQVAVRNVSGSSEPTK